MGKTGHTIASSGLASFIFELRAVHSRHRLCGDLSIFATAIEVQVQYYCRHRRRQDFAMEDGGISSTRWLLLVMAVSVFFMWRPLQDDAGDLPVRSIFATASERVLVRKVRRSGNIFRTGSRADTKVIKPVQYTTQAIPGLGMRI
jgi:hypothetical protein